MNVIVRALVVWMALFVPVQAAQWVVSLPAIERIISPALGPQDRLTVLLPPGQSPHHWALKPSQLRALARADHIVLTSRQMEGPVWRWVAANRPEKVVLVWADLPSVRKIAGEGGHAHHAHEHEHGHAADDLTFNPHLWLSPHNARLLLQTLAQRGWLEAPRAQAVIETIARKQTQVNEQLQPLQGVPYLSYHDAFAYFETTFGLKPLAIVEPGEGGRLGLKRLLSLRQLMTQHQVRCIVYPAHQRPAVLKNLARDLPVRLQPLDALGWQQRDYAGWLESLARGYAACLNPS